MTSNVMARWGTRDTWYLLGFLGGAAVLLFVGRDWLPASSATTWGISFISAAAAVVLVVALLRVQEELRTSQSLLARQQMDLEFAREVQAALFPKELPTDRGLDFAAVCIPAAGISGDYYDVIETTDGRVVFLVGDVSGKGVSAAILMANLHGRLRALVETCTSTAEICTLLNRHLVAFTEPERFVTLFLAQCRPGTPVMEYVNAGHEIPFCLDGDIKRLEEGGLPLGILEDAEYSAGSLELREGSLLALYSDGITESMNAQQEEFGVERLKGLLLENRRRSLQEIQQVILQSVRAWSGKPPSDDMTLMLIRVRDLAALQRGGPSANPGSGVG
ncbi:MAG TPA: PP2C family protein-serine/threonine phosphatase [Acidobacteriota bacterium]|nr:PP2C family protein-serine/threonine phosphatase [Acidobacteriota bacterium]HRR55536.1 PP2C family protein-serine/threonine phosphatase [Acidobacteriota bacterium]HRV07025.1 PP2C family protein-serine/threonine phosphatase [Acidobacteriota bacterium]